MNSIGRFATLVAMTIALPVMAMGFNWSLDPSAGASPSVQTNRVQSPPADAVVVDTPVRATSEFTMWTIFIVGFSTVGAKLRARQSRAPSRN